MTAVRARRFQGFAQSEIRRMTLACNRVNGLNLAQGLCDLPVPDVVRTAAEDALRGRTNTYSTASGIPELREAIARKLERDNGISADPNGEIIVTAGVTGAYHSTIYGLLDPGDGILLFEPYYGYHYDIARVAGLAPRFATLDPPQRSIDEAFLRSALDPDTRAVVLCTPSNPAGKMWQRSEIEALARVAEERDLLVITDEIYEYFSYDGRQHVSPASVSALWPRSVTLVGYSKTFAITGWRIGCAVAPAALAASILLANDLTYICAPRPFQHAVAQGIESLPPSWYRELARAFQSKRDRVCDALTRGGFTPLVPQGSYYVMAQLNGVDDARTAAMQILERCGVATVPGTAFMRGPAGDTFVRVCFAKEDAVLDEACERLARL